MKKFLTIFLIFIMVTIGLLSSLCLPSPSPTKADTPPTELVDQRTRTSKLYWLGEDKYAIDASIASVHYKEDPDDINELWKDIDTDIVPSDRPNWDWEVVKGNWTLLIKNDTTVALGKDGHWIGFQYKGFGYLDVNTKEYEILQTRQMVTPVVDGNTIRWEGIFYGTNLEYIYGPDGFKENLEVTQTARDWLAAHPPGNYGLNNLTSYLVGYLECDWVNAYPAEDDNGDLINLDQVWESETGSIFFRNPIRDKIVTALPVSWAIHEDLSPENWVPIRKRFYSSEGTNYLLFGASVTALNQMPDGTIVLDPTVEEQVGSSNNDGYANDSSTYSADGDYAIQGSLIGYSYSSWTLFEDITVSGTVDVAYLIGHVFQATGSGTYTNIYANDTQTPAYPTDRAEVFSKVRTTEYAAWDGQEDPDDWANSPDFKNVIQELVDDYTYDGDDDIMILIDDDGSGSNERFSFHSWDYDDHSYGAYLHIEYSAGGASAPTVVTNAASSVEDTTATLSGNITATGGENADYRGFEWDTDSGAPYSSNWTEGGDFGTGEFTHGISSLPEGTTIYFRAIAHNSGGWGYGDEETFLTKPAAPTNVSATDGSSSSNVTVTWNKPTGATDFQVYRDDTPLGWLGDVDTYEDTGADAPTITAGSAVASDGTSTSNVTLSLSDMTTNNGTTHTYKVRAKNATGESDDSSTDTGYRGPGSPTYQWQRSSTDNDDGYSNITGATAATYEDTDAPAPTITPGSADATDGTYVAYVELTLDGESANVGAGRYYKCVLNATGCSENTSASNRGYRGVGSLTFQWQRSSADADEDYSNIDGATTETYQDTGAPENGDGRYFQCVLNATGAASDNSSSDRGYRGTLSVPTLTTSNATSVQDTSATLNGNITDHGGENCDYRGFEWGLSSGNYSANWTEGGSFGTGAFSHGITGLSDNTTYFYRSMAHNGAGWGYGNEISFTTEITSPTLAPPTDFTLTQTNLDEVTITWAKEASANTTVIRVATDEYPSSPTDGWGVYNDTGENTTDTGLNLAMIEYYYRAWSWNDTIGYSTSYAQGTIGGDDMAELATSIGTFTDTFTSSIGNLLMILPVVLLSILAFWKSDTTLGAILFMLTGAVALMTGLYWYDAFTNNLGLAISLSLIAYWLVCFGLALRLLFWRGEVQSDQ